MRRGLLWRYKDHSGVSGLGPVADLVLFPDLSLAVRWRGENASTSVWESLEKLIAVHGHEGDTEVVWIDPPPVADYRLNESL